MPDLDFIRSTNMNDKKSEERYDFVKSGMMKRKVDFQTVTTVSTRKMKNFQELWETLISRRLIQTALILEAIISAFLQAERITMFFKEMTRSFQTTIISAILILIIT
jgi:hypothetical protein